MSALRSPYSLRALAALALAVLASGASARSRIIDGTDVPAGQYPEVFAIAQSLDEATLVRTLCTAVLVHPQVLLTAAHCLPEDPSRPVTVIAGPDARAPLATYASARTARNRAYFTTQSDIQATGYDLGVVVLEKPMPGADAETGAGLAKLASIADGAIVETLHRDGAIVVGYGGKNTAYTDASTGTKRSATAKVLEISTYAFSTSGPSAAVSRGDSGGPAYVVDATGELRLIGIASGVPKSRRLDVAGLPGLSLYASMRSELACWVEKASGFPLPSLPGSRGCEPETISFGALN